MTAHYIGLDVHCQFTEFAVVTSSGRVTERGQCPTTIPALVAVIESIKRPRYVAFEEGPMAEWLYRNLLASAEGVTACEPRRNRWIAQDGEKDDPLDAAKVAQLHRGGYLKADPLLRKDLQVLWESYDLTALHVAELQRSLRQLARKHEVLRRFQEVSGIGPVWAATFYVYVDTPWRFASKEKLWKYLGIGLERRRSGKGPVQLQVPKSANRRLKWMILSAAESAIRDLDSPFAAQYARGRNAGLSHDSARRNVARSLAATLWGMWKSGARYRPELVGRRGTVGAEGASKFCCARRSS